MRPVTTKLILWGFHAGGWADVIWRLQIREEVQDKVENLQYDGPCGADDQI